MLKCRRSYTTTVRFHLSFNTNSKTEMLKYSFVSKSLIMWWFRCVNLPKGFETQYCLRRSDSLKLSQHLGGNGLQKERRFLWHTLSRAGAEKYASLTFSVAAMKRTFLKAFFITSLTLLQSIPSNVFNFYDLLWVNICIFKDRAASRMQAQTFTLRNW